VRRRNFITLVGSTMVMGSLTAHAQQSGGMRRIGVLMSHPETDPDAQAFLAAFREGLQKLGRTEGRNVRLDARWTSAGNVEEMQRFAKELVALQPDLLLGDGILGSIELHGRGANGLYTLFPGSGQRPSRHWVSETWAPSTVTSSSAAFGR
jgi:hypothetical protein